MNRENPARQYRMTPTNDAGEATIYLYDVIDPYFGVSAEQFVKDLRSISAATIHLRVNSPGGDVFEGRAIATAIRQHAARVISHVDGMAASAASWIALAGDEVEISDGSFFMIHKAWSFAFGNADDLMEAAALLEKIDEDLVREYVAETGQPEDQIREWLRAETWFNADEAVENGFADRKAAEFDGSKNAWDLSVYGHVPNALAQTQKPLAVKASDTEVFVKERLSARLDWAAAERKFKAVARGAR